MIIHFKCKNNVCARYIQHALYYGHFLATWLSHDRYYMQSPDLSLLLQIQSLAKMWKAKRKYSRRLQYFKDHVSCTTREAPAWQPTWIGADMQCCLCVCLCRRKKLWKSRLSWKPIKPEMTTEHWVSQDILCSCCLTWYLYKMNVEFYHFNRFIKQQSLEVAVLSSKPV